MTTGRINQVTLVKRRTQKLRSLHFVCLWTLLFVTTEQNEFWTMDQGSVISLIEVSSLAAPNFNATQSACKSWRLCLLLYMLFTLHPIASLWFFFLELSISKSDFAKPTPWWKFLSNRSRSVKNGY